MLASTLRWGLVARATQGCSFSADNAGMNRRFVLSCLCVAVGLLATVAAEAKGQKQHKQKGGGHGRGHGGAPPGHARKMKYKVSVAPPQPRVEPKPVAPSARHTWIPGYWNWTGQNHVWVTGAWNLPPQQNVAWVEPQWVNEGGAWLFFEGQWSLSIR